ncbi:MAG: 4Fe-4S binding protein [Anaerolineae bacterium]|nr:4Fe-4S binding protein [Anaerolineae bacterium]
MNINSVKLIYFSPTQTTKKILTNIARGMGVNNTTHIDLTLPGIPAQIFVNTGMPEGTAVLIGAPVYGGRLPQEARQRLRQVQGKGTLAVIVVVYGNREYEDALLELRDLAEEVGFQPIAGGAFLGEHSFSSEGMPIAHGRPDGADLEKAAAFGWQIREKIADIDTLSAILPLHVPGNYPYKQWEQSRGSIAPVVREGLCTYCGVCADVCPTAAITVSSDAVETDAHLCIWCCACTRACPTGARVMEHPRILHTKAWLHEDYSARKEPEVYL